MNQNIPTQPTYATPPAWMEDEIDLREYIAVLIKYWRIIIGVALLAAIVAFAVSSFLPRVYEATASAIILKSKTQVSFDPKFQTTTEDQSTQKGYQDTLVGLVTNGEVAGTVFENQRDALPATVTGVADLLKKVNASSAGDIISIKVSDTDPTLTANLADAWVEAYVTYVNQLYSDRTAPLQVDVQSQAGETETAYRAAQSALESFLKNNRIDALQREISVKQAQIKKLREQGSRVEQTPVDLFAFQLTTWHTRLQNKYDQLALIETWLDDAASIRTHVTSAETTAAGAGDALALLMLQRKALAHSADVDSQLQLQVSPADFSGVTVSIADVDSLIATLQQRQNEIKQDVQSLSTQFLATSDAVTLSPTPATLESYLQTLDAGVSELQSALEAQSAKKRELQQTRDLAWNNYTTIRRKLAELQLSSQITDSQVRLAAKALTPDKPVSSKRLMNTAVAGALGLMLAVFAVFAWEYWRNNGDDETIMSPATTEQK